MLKESVYHNYIRQAFNASILRLPSSGLWENVKLHRIKMSTYQRSYHLSGCREFWECCGGTPHGTILTKLGLCMPPHIVWYGGGPLRRDAFWVTWTIVKVCPEVPHPICGQLIFLRFLLWDGSLAQIHSFLNVPGDPLWLPANYGDTILTEWMSCGLTGDV